MSVGEYCVHVLVEHPELMCALRTRVNERKSGGCCTECRQTLGARYGKVHRHQQTEYGYTFLFLSMDII